MTHRTTLHLDGGDGVPARALGTDHRGGPEPTDVTLESVGRPVPEA